MIESNAHTAINGSGAKCLMQLCNAGVLCYYLLEHIFKILQTVTVRICVTYVQKVFTEWCTVKYSPSVTCPSCVLTSPRSVSMSSTLLSIAVSFSPTSSNFVLIFSFKSPNLILMLSVVNYTLLNLSDNLNVLSFTRNLYCSVCLYMSYINMKEVWCRQILFQI